VQPDILTFERRLGIAMFEPGDVGSGRLLTHRKLAFWMLFVGTAFLMIYVRVMMRLDVHPIFLAYVWAVAATIILRYVFYAIYKPPLLISGEYQPSVTVIVPAKNESSVVYQTAESLNRLDYPKDKISVILVNDGSEDDTGFWIDKCRDDFGFHAIHLNQNMGKRLAIAKAMENNISDITVLVDSDSSLREDSLLEGLRGFSSPKIAAICGHTDVENSRVTWLTRMQTQQYFIAFKTFKSLEGFFGSVICCSGAFSIYRTAAIMPLIDVWKNQKFLGRTRTFGDDRGLTNLLLKEGYDTIYIPEAKAKTIVPQNLRTYLKQQLRWRRSFLMESFSALGHMWRRPLGASTMFYVVLSLTLMSPFVVSYFLFLGPIISGFNPLVYLAGLALIILLHQTFYWAFNLPPADKVGFFSLMPMLPVWIFFTLALLPYAMLTIRTGSWGTR
tara:strand:- start:467 stop:1798 length:1332 start_codon:yes stop_codon:yes gene_type:complete